MAETLTVDGVNFDVARSERRTTAAIVIDRDGRLVLQVPVALDTDSLRSAAKSRLPWVYRKLSERLLRAHVPVKEFVAGERFRYLGRSYRLAFVPDADLDGVALRHGRLEVPGHRRDEAEELLREWYLSRGQTWFDRRLASWTERMGMPGMAAVVRDLGYRWASYSESGTVNFHWQAVALPATISDYLIVHELTHVEHPTHDKDYWRALLKVMPDGERRRDWLRAEGEGW